MVFALYILIGALAGVLAGLFGVGGGLIIVPALLVSFSVYGFAPEIVTHLAIGTSLATIVITSISSTRTHHQKKAVDWNLFKQLSPGILLGSLLGVYTATQLNGRTLQGALGIFALLMATRLWYGHALSASACGNQPTKPWVLTTGGGIIGWASGMFGIGGGALSVPFLRWRRVPMTLAIGTSAACGLPIAIMATAANMIMGADQPFLPAYATGFVYWPAFIGIVLTSVPFSRLGAKWAHNLPASRLQQGFALFLVAVGVKLLWAAL